MNDIRLIQLNTYLKPEIKENKTKNWVLNGKNNNFYDYLIDLYKSSSTHASIVNTFVDLIYGKGLSYKTGSTQDWVNVASILNPKEIKKIILDYVLFSEASIQVIENRGKKLSEIAHINRKNIAPSIANEDNEIESYWYCEDFSRTNQNTPKDISAFKVDNSGNYIYNIKNYDPSNKYFSDPEYMSILSYCELEKEMGNFYLKAIHQGLSAGYIINIPDGNSLTPEEKDELERQIKSKLTGSQNALNFIISFNGRDAEITIIPFPVNEQMHKQWDSLNEMATQKILTGHRVTSPSIAGIVSSSGFSNTADEMDTAEAQLMKRIIAPKQNVIIDALEEILEQYGINMRLYFKPLTEEKALDVNTELSKHVCMSEHSELDELIALGEEISDDYELIDEIEAIDTKLTENHLNTIVQFAVNTPNFDKPRRTESEQDTSIFKIRYKYAGNPTPEREFCSRLMSANKVYRAEDLDKEQKTAPNMGANGSDKYNVFLYKGGVNCKHFWQRQIYMKKEFKKISVSQARKMILQLDPRERKDAKWDENPKEVAQIAESKNNYWSLDPKYRK